MAFIAFWNRTLHFDSDFVLLNKNDAHGSSFQGKTTANEKRLNPKPDPMMYWKASMLTKQKIEAKKELAEHACFCNSQREKQKK